MNNSIKTQFEDLRKQAKDTAVRLKDEGKTMAEIGGYMVGSKNYAAKMTRARSLIDRGIIGDPEAFLENVKKAEV